MRLLPLALAAFAALALGAETQKAAPPVSAKEGKDAKEAKRKDISALLKLLAWPSTNSDAARQQLKAAAKEPSLASFPAAYWKDYEAAASPEAFERILVPLFDKAYSHEEIKTFIKLVSTPEFKLFAEKNPESLVKKDAYEGFSKYMTEVGGKLREKHGIKAVPAPVKK